MEDCDISLPLHMNELLQRGTARKPTTSGVGEVGQGIDYD